VLVSGRSSTPVLPGVWAVLDYKTDYNALQSQREACPEIIAGHNRCRPLIHTSEYCAETPRLEFLPSTTVW